MIVTSVFLVQLLCAIVPCNPKYELPDLSKAQDQYSNEPSAWDSFKTFSRHLWDNYENVEESEPEKQPPIVHTFSGIVEGYFMTVVGGKVIYAFENIPYAEAPVGNLRFRAPVPKTPWKGIFNANGDTPTPCLQYNIPKVFRVIGREDCLKISVFSSKIPSPENPNPKLPVYFFIHGGGFFFGGARSYGPAYLLQEDVVLCVVQYRLGVLGFMSSGDNASTEFFGGDPNRVTLIGQSAGSAMVHFHMLSRQSRPYFHRAISMSGVALNYWALHDIHDARNYSQTLARIVGCPVTDSEEMVECFRKTNPVLLVTLTQRFLDNWPYPSNAWRPCIEITQDNPDAFLTDSPLALYAKHDVARVPWIVTLVSGEGYQFLLFPFITFQMKTLRKNWYRLAPDLADIDQFSGLLNLDVITEKIKKYYFPNVQPEYAPIHNFANIVTSRMFLLGIYKAAQLHSKIAPTYSYIFDVNGQYNLIQNYGYSRKEWGVGHAEDLFYIFNSTLNYIGFKRSDPEFRTSQFLVNIFTNFAAKGEPLLTDENGKENYVWLPHNGPKHLKFLKIEAEVAYMIQDPFEKTIEFWDELMIPDTPSGDQIILNDSNNS